MDAPMKSDMFVLSLFCSVLLSLSAVPAFAARPEKPHPLDQEMESCMQKNDSTLGMQDCYVAYAKRWDQLLNKYYQSLGGDKNAALRNSQVAWLKYRDAEFRRIETKYQDLTKRMGGGTIYSLLAGSDKLQVVRQRVLLLLADHELNTCGMEGCD
jgi:uncharacterized protein YecT (DUF1311 family)